MFTWSRSDAACAEIRRLDLVLLQYGLGKAALVLLAGAMFICSRVVSEDDGNFCSVQEVYTEKVFLKSLLLFTEINGLWFGSVIF